MAERITEMHDRCNFVTFTCLGLKKNEVISILDCEIPCLLFKAGKCMFSVRFRIQGVYIHCNVIATRKAFQR